MSDFQDECFRLDLQKYGLSKFAFYSFPSEYTNIVRNLRYSSHVLYN